MLRIVQGGEVEAAGGAADVPLQPLIDAMVMIDVAALQDLQMFVACLEVRQTDGTRIVQLAVERAEPHGSQPISDPRGWIIIGWRVAPTPAALRAVPVKSPHVQVCQLFVGDEISSVPIALARTMHNGRTMEVTVIPVADAIERRVFVRVIDALINLELRGLVAGGAGRWSGQPRGLRLLVRGRGAGRWSGQPPT